MLKLSLPCDPLVREVLLERVLALSSPSSRSLQLLEPLSERSTSHKYPVQLVHRPSAPHASTCFPLPLSSPASPAAPAADPAPAPSVASGFSTRTPLALGSLSLSESAAEPGTVYPLEAVAAGEAGAALELLSCHAGSPGGLMLNGREDAADEGAVDGAPGAEVDEGDEDEEGDEVGAGRRAMRSDLSDLSSVWRSASEVDWAEACLSRSCGRSRRRRNVSSRGRADGPRARVLERERKRDAPRASS